MFIQIPRWLVHPGVWRFLGFVSTIIGLVCYALSSSFNYLFGKWNLAKLFVYIVLSIVICLGTLFAKAWQHSPSLRFRAHAAFLVLTIASVYSFFFDKAVNGKPDAYSLVSCVAFAMMSLSLSRQIHCGFEVDLLYFFLGALIVQLMKINKLLGMIGVCFSYFLVILRSSLDAPQESYYLGLRDRNHVVVQVDSQQSDTDNALIMAQFMASIGALRQRNSVLIDMILKHVHVKGYSKAIGNFVLVIDHNLVLDTLPSGIIDDIQEAAKSAVAVGFEKEFSESYSSCRRECLEGCLSRLLYLQNVRIEARRTWTLRENYMIDSWIKASSVALKLLFPSERRLCDRVFSGLSSAADLCFMETCREATTQLLNLADVYANGSRPLQQILHIFEALCDLIPDFKSLFCDGHTVCLVKEAVTIQNRLREAISLSYTRERNVIFHNKVGTLDAPIGGVHPITRNAMNYIRWCCRSRKNLEPILQEYLMGADGARTLSSFSVDMVSLLERLERKLKTNSKNYEDHALRSFFMMNNWRYIQNQIKKWDLETHLSDEWVQNNMAKVQQNLELYYRTSWNKVLDYLKLDKESLAPNVAAESMKERLNLFNSLFEEMCIVQSTWFLGHAQYKWSLEDIKVRKEIITYLENILLPAYGNFIGRFIDVLATNASKYIKYGMFDIEARLKGLFRLPRK